MYTNEEKKKPKFRHKKAIGFGVLAAGVLAASTFCAIHFSRQEQPGKAIKVDFDMKNKIGTKGSEKEFITKMDTSLTKFKDDLNKKIKDKNTNWSNQKSEFFKVGDVFMGGSVGPVATSVNMAKEAVKELEKFLKPFPTAKEKLTFKFKNEFLRDVLADMNHFIKVNKLK